MRAALLASTALLASAITAQAQSWTGAVSTDWFTAGNWNGGIPATNSSPTIDSTNPGGQGAIVNAATNALTQMNVGVNAQGLLTITAGGSILMNDGVLGANAGSTGTVIVTGTGTWNTNNDLVVGGNGNNTPGGTGDITVKNGGTVTVTHDTVISASSGGVGTVTVDGAGGASTWTTGNDTYVGGTTSGTFKVLSGGAVTANRNTYLGFFSGATGTLTIDGTNSQWTSTSGLFDVGGNGGSGTAGTGVVNVTNGGKLDTAASNVFLGDGSTGTGKGTLNLSGATSVWNGSNVAVGETGTGILNITNGGVANISGQVIVGDCDCSNGTVTVSGAGSQFNATGGGARNVVIGWDGAGTFKALDGATATVAGEVVVGQGAGSGTFGVESGASFTADQLTIGSNTATGTVTVTGAGSLLTSNTNTFIGAGSTADNKLNVLDGATGTLGNIVVGFFGGTGTLKIDATSQVNGTGYSQNATSTFNVGISPTGNGKVAITGADINLDGALVVTAKTTQAKTYNIMTTNPPNGVLGTFSSVSVIGNANNLQVLYNQPCGVGCTAVQLTVDAFSLANVLPPGTSSNAGNVAGALDKAIASGMTIPDPFFAVFALQGQALDNALSQLSGEPTTGTAQSNIQIMNAFLSLMLNPFGGAPGGNPGTLNYARDFGAAGNITPQAAAAYAAVTPKDRRIDPVAARWGVWGQAYGGYTKTSGDSTAGTHDTTARTYGLATGFDYRVSGDTAVGFALAGAGENWGVSDGLGGGRADTLQLGAYGSKQFGAAYLSGALAYAVHNVTTDRTVTVAGSDHLTANFTTQSVGGRIEAGYRFLTPYAGITPYAAVQVQGFFTPSYSENAVSGSNVFALSFASHATAASRTELGTWLDKTFLLADGKALALRGRVAWANDQSSDRAVTATFQTLPGASFTVNGAAPAANLALTSAGAEYRLANNVSIGVKFDGEFASASQTYAGTGTVRYVW